MVRRYKKQNKVRQYDETNMHDAVEAVKSGTLSARQAAHVYNVPRSSIGNFITGRSVRGASLGRPPAISRDIEHNLVEATQTAASNGFGINRKKFLINTGALNKRIN